MTWSLSAPPRRFEFSHSSILGAAGRAWVLAAAFLATSAFVRRETSLPSAFASTPQVMGVVALLGAVLGMVWGFASLAVLLSRHGDKFGALIFWSTALGIPLVVLYGLGLLLLLPALAALTARGRLRAIPVRRPAAALLAGLVTPAFTIGWPPGMDWAVLLYVASFLAGSVEGAALVWFARTTETLVA